MSTETLSLQYIIEQDLRIPLEELANHPALVRQIQQALRQRWFTVEVNSCYDERTRQALYQFCREVWLDTFTRGVFGKTLAQKLLEEFKRPEGNGIASPFYFPAGRRPPELSERELQMAAGLYRLEPAVLKAIIKVETNGRAFDNKGRPIILFEAHWFSYLTQHRFDLTHPQISSRKWNPKLYRTGDREWERLELALSLNQTAALESTSWGIGQVLGVNYKYCGYANVQDFARAMCESAFNQLMAMLSFLEKSGLLQAARAKDWERLARGYNGPEYYKNNYHIKLAQAYASYQKR